MDYCIFQDTDGDYGCTTIGNHILSQNVKIIEEFTAPCTCAAWLYFQRVFLGYDDYKPLEGGCGVPGCQHGKGVCHDD